MTTVDKKGIQMKMDEYPVPHRLGGNRRQCSPDRMLAKIVARLSLVMALYEEDRKDDFGADHHRMIVAAVKAKDAAKAKQLMDYHLADIEGHVKLTEGQGDRHTFLAVLEHLS